MNHAKSLAAKSTKKSAKLFAPFVLFLAPFHIANTPIKSIFKRRHKAAALT
jgi:hypothetical protein